MEETNRTPEDILTNLYSDNKGNFEKTLDSAIAGECRLRAKEAINHEDERGYCRYRPSGKDDPIL